VLKLSVGQGISSGPESIQVAPCWCHTARANCPKHFLGVRQGKDDITVGTASDVHELGLLMHWQEECQLVYLLHQWYAWPQILAKACMMERDEGAALLAHSHWYSNEQRRPVWIAQTFGGDLIGAYPAEKAA
jgi:hypothetical protein